MKNVSLAWVGKLSSGVFRAAEFADAWFGLPRKVADSLHFRQEWRRSLPPPGTFAARSSLWIHGASVGELEDLMAFFADERLLERVGLAKSDLVLTAASVSAASRLEKLAAAGYRYAGPLPPETVSEVSAFLKELQPRLLVLSHADFWPVLLAEAANSLSAGCLWMPARPPSSWNMSELCLKNFVTAIGVRAKHDENIFRERPAFGLAPGRVRWVGNSRVDRILSRMEASQAKPHPLEEYGCAPNATEGPHLLVGSCWLEDARALAQALLMLGESAARLRITVIPHEVRDPHMVAAIKSQLPSGRVLAVEGVLAESYRGFDAALVGGGFRTGLHNILEPALWGVPTAVGPLLKKQPEAGQLVDAGQLRVVATVAELTAFLREIIDAPTRDLLRRRASGAANLLRAHAGSSERLADFVGEMWKV